jgi:hypothetical protein
LAIPGDKLLWIEDRSLRPADAPSAFVEYSTGDRFPGQVIGYRTGQEDRHFQRPPHFVVAPEVAINCPDDVQRKVVPVAARWLRRVVWHKRAADRLQPGTLFYRDGRQISCQAVRWSTDAIKVLVEGETREVPFGEVAELHLPSTAAWDAWLEQLACLAPSLEGTLLQVEAAGGIRWTSSLERFVARARDGDNPDEWYHGFQPPWSLEVLWLPHRSIRMRRFFDPQQPPLTLFEPSSDVQRPVLAGGWNWQRDRSVRKQPLRTASRSFGWGIGVHAHSELSFEVPSFVTGIRTQYGLDQAVGRGGCVRAAVYDGLPRGKPLHESQILIGSEKYFDTGALSLPAAGHVSRRLILVVDPVSDERPAGADPFDIRDEFNWLQPALVVDSARLQEEVRKRYSQVIPAWLDWELAPDESANLTLRNVAAPGGAQTPQKQFHTEIGSRGGSIALSQRLELSGSQRFLAIAVCRSARDTPGSRIQVLVDGREAAQFEVPVRAGDRAPEPMFVPFERWQGRTVSIAIKQTSGAPQSLVEWRGIGWTADPR